MLPQRGVVSCGIGVWAGWVASTTGGVAAALFFGGEGCVLLEVLHDSAGAMAHELQSAIHPTHT